MGEHRPGEGRIPVTKLLRGPVEDSERVRRRRAESLVPEQHEGANPEFVAELRVMNEDPCVRDEARA